MLSRHTVRPYFLYPDGEFKHAARRLTADHDRAGLLQQAAWSVLACSGEPRSPAQIRGSAASALGSGHSTTRARPSGSPGSAEAESPARPKSSRACKSQRVAAVQPAVIAEQGPALAPVYGGDVSSAHPAGVRFFRSGVARAADNAADARGTPNTSAHDRLAARPLAP